MKKNILVTGSHRSGTTWVGKIMAKAKGAHYVHEPFNLSPELERKHSPLSYWFEYLDDETSREHQNKVKDYVNSFSTVLHVNTIKRLVQIRRLGKLRKYFKDIVNRPLADRTIIKDPIAIMSAEWIYKNHDVDVVVLIRHPAAFVASIKVKNWHFDFAQYEKQHALMKKHLSNYKAIINEFANNKKDIIDQGILLWNTIHEVILNYQNKYEKEWHFVKHEDLSADPILEFGKLFSGLGLDFDSKVQAYVNVTSNSEQNSDIVKKSTAIANVNRNSSENIKAWKKRLSEDEIERIKTGTKGLWEKFYVEDDW
ncbi:sulfotransferase domain-containing protein [Algoriphagus aestuariicola]|uniref:Sulfotransferase domain-containing protein n=1 Tax=Algoriphagus aestuariicola TaxID=1852016 RepID=A0ABS3BRK3_9BACT|nr:sulfotransferase [Algoriphagus aestuariicola]MBN7801925.1 sulfotransferase domain-containing protein [Algoriphagus aestuariicola]